MAIAGQGVAAKPDTIRRVTFGGRVDVILPAGTPMLSDPVNLVLKPATDLIVSVYLPESAAQAQAANGLLSMVVDGRDATLEVLPADAKPASIRPIVSAVYVQSTPSEHTIVTFGDSITDGARSTSQEVRGWPGVLAQRLSQARGPTYTVANEGIGGNRLLHNGIGTNALARFDRDVLSLPSVSHVIVLEGINDIGLQGMSFAGASETTVGAEDLIAAYRQLISRAHQHHIKIYGGTLLPFRGAGYFSEDKEKIRAAVNHWIRSAVSSMRDRFRSGAARSVRSHQNGRRIRFGRQSASQRPWIRRPWAAASTWRSFWIRASSLDGRGRSTPSQGGGPDARLSKRHGESGRVPCSRTVPGSCLVRNRHRRGDR